MHPAHLTQIRRLALTPATSGTGLLKQIRALDELVRKDGRVPVEQVTEILIEAIDDRFGTWESSRAASMAGQLLTYMQECLAGDGLQWPASDPDELAPADYWPGVSDEFASLDRMDTKGLRDAWREAVQGPPPWKPDEVLAE